MAVSKEYRDYIVSKLSRAAPVSARDLFDGVGLYSGGQLFAILANDRLYFKTDAAGRADFESFGAPMFQPCDQSPLSPRFYQLPEAVLKDGLKLIQWINRACACGDEITSRFGMAG